jgi:hypothetical protein
MERLAAAALGAGIAHLQRESTPPPADPTEQVQKVLDQDVEVGPADYRFMLHPSGPNTIMADQDHQTTSMAKLFRHRLERSLLPSIDDALAKHKMTVEQGDELKGLVRQHVADMMAHHTSAGLTARGQAQYQRVKQALENLHTPGKKPASASFLEGVRAGWIRHTDNAGALAVAAKDDLDAFDKDLTEALAAGHDKVTELISKVKGDLKGVTTYKKLSQSPGAFLFETSRVCGALTEMWDAAVKHPYLKQESAECIYMAQVEARQQLTHLQLLAERFGLSKAAMLVATAGVPGCISKDALKQLVHNLEAKKAIANTSAFQKGGQKKVSRHLSFNKRDDSSSSSSSSEASYASSSEDEGGDERGRRRQGQGQGSQGQGNKRKRVRFDDQPMSGGNHHHSGSNHSNRRQGQGQGHGKGKGKGNNKGGRRYY